MPGTGVTGAGAAATDEGAGVGAAEQAGVPSHGDFYGIASIVVFVFVLRLVFKLQNKHAQHMVEKERAKAEKTREEAVKQAREEGRAEAMAAQQAQEAEAASAEPAAEASAPDAASDDAQNEMVGNAAEKES